MLTFDTKGILLPGVHWLTWQEVYNNFGYNQYRRNLLFGMMIGLNSLKQVGCQEVYIDGSFATQKQLPGDFDICYEDSTMDFDQLEIIDPTILSFENLRAAQKGKYGGEFFPMTAVAAPPDITYFEFFQIDKNTGDPKGIVGLKLATT
ncbi:DUF6932 family protein [Spirosoma arboris]|nr:hypothetical protein [Spirosoma arboris]